MRWRGQGAIIGDLDQQPPGEIHKTAQREVNNHLMMFQPLATLHRAEVSQEAIMPVTHASEPAVSELGEHIPKMHLAATVSNLDGSESLHIPSKFQIRCDRPAAERGTVRTHMGLTSPSANHGAAPCPTPRFAAI